MEYNIVPGQVAEAFLCPIAVLGAQALLRAAQRSAGHQRTVQAAQGGDAAAGCARAD